MMEIKNKLLNAHKDAEEYKQIAKKMYDDLEKYTEFIERVFEKPFKIKGIRARVDDYSLHGNWIDVYPYYPDEGIDCLTLTFKEFSELLEFIEE